MDKLKQIAKAIVEEFAAWYGTGDTTVQTQVIADDERGHYLLYRLGWSQDRYIHHCMFHLDVIDDKVWIQYNDTDVLLADELIQRSVAPTSIVLGHRHPRLRPLTGYATA